jgi:mannose-6-phosphate isomerase-like protein (cupin superfamily)
VLIILEGQATLEDGNETRDVAAGDIVLIPAGQPHGFVNSGEGRLRQIDIHVSPSFSTEWLEKGEP